MFRLIVCVDNASFVKQLCICTSAFLLFAVARFFLGKKVPEVVHT